MEELMPKIRRVALVLAILAVLGVSLWGYLEFRQWQAARNQRILSAEVDALFEAFHKYKQIVGKYPSGSNAEIARAIREGNNEKKLMILAVKDSQLNAKGEIVDPWGTPLKIYFAQNEVLIRSAGPNRQFEDARVAMSDDYFRSD
ncbi:MAG: hypothetical protein ACK45B_15705 [Limisphaerales bacterium]